MPSRLLVVWALAFLGACAALLAPGDAARERARVAGFVEVDLPDPRIKAFLRTRGAPDGRLTVYIEGDGAPWPWPNMPPADPTPLRHIVLGMAGADPSGAVAYLGRPCQYLEVEALAGCDPSLWTDGRFGADAIAATDRAIDVLKRTAGASSIALVGYSGGGAIATLVAAGRRDAACLVTLASPLDSDAWTDAIGVSRMDRSRNPLEVAARIAAIPQTHLQGKSDRLVPPASTARFMSRVPQAQVLGLEGVDHQCCWEDIWPKVRPTTCLGQRTDRSAASGTSSAEGAGRW